MNRKRRNILLGAEFIILFFGVPLFLFFEDKIIHPSYFLLPALFALIIYFRKQKEFRWRDLIRLGISRKMWLKQGLIVLLVAIFLFAFVLIFEPEQLFNLSRGNPSIWLAMLVFYPLFSAYVQEVVFRKFLFMRYRPLFQKRWALVISKI